MSAIENGVNGVKHTFSSWDSCMSKAYCKWPVIAGIIIGSLILLSVLYCVVQIICCGAQCCFCLASISRCLCCGCCRGSGRGNRGGDNYDGHVKNNGYVRPADYNTSYQPSYMAQGQYASQPAPHYGPPSTATFDAPTKNTRRANEDALPAMPSWSDAQSRRVEDHHSAHDDVEMGKLNNAGQSEPMLPKFESDDYAYARGDSAHGIGSNSHNTGDLGLGAGAMATSPYRDTYSRQDTYRGSSPAPTYHTHQQYGQGNRGYGQAQTYDSPYNNYDHNPSTTTAVGTAYTAAHTAQPYSPTRSAQPQQQQSYNAQRTQSPTYAPQQQQQQQHGYSAPQQSQQQGYTAYPGQASYQAHEPTSPSVYSSVPETTRKPVQGSWRDV
ncbi:hypothetical protein K461DRAFT_324102 [Myriangium duriaei CBS 260.36]|uniref:Uncharacterized protein n=1 Tax=Myriangium duriaei CBS 260.36 TaxID=1168546 RepID=A0A9P4MH47_9PEZI|nr:hypothetical protein K461DRAFT_324102 [Myriangium duriaei CBS 260.36]